MKWGSGFFVRLNHAARLSASLLCLTAHPYHALGAPMPFRLGVVGSGWWRGEAGSRGVIGMWGVVDLRAGECLRRGRGVGGAHGRGAG